MTFVMQGGPPLPAEVQARWERLHAYLLPLERVVVAYSGGIDSTLVLAAAARALGPGAVRGVIGVSPSLAGRDLEGALRVGQEMGVVVERLDTHELDRPGYQANGPDRCYFCKTELYTALRDYLVRAGSPHILDGTNAEDRLDLRPGHRAAVELGVKSPLLECGFTKAHIRELALAWGLSNWSKPAAPCLSSRIPHFSEVTREKLRAVEQAEACLAALGFTDYRVRHLGETARIELPPSDWGRLLGGETCLTLTRRFQELGFRYVTLDLLGLRPGNLSVALPES